MAIIASTNFDAATPPALPAGGSGGPLIPTPSGTAKSGSVALHNGQPYGGLFWHDAILPQADASVSCWFRFGPPDGTTYCTPILRGSSKTLSATFPTDCYYANVGIGPDGDAGVKLFV